MEMSSYYLCETCAKHYVDAPPKYPFIEFHICAALGREIGMLIMHDGIERPTDLCGHYEREERHG